MVIFLDCISTNLNNNIRLIFGMPIKYNSYIVRYSEIALKGKNRGNFERKLIDNIKIQFSDKKIDSIIRPVGRIIIDSNDELDLRCVMGISSYSPALKIKHDGKTDLTELKKVIDLFIERFNKSSKYSNFRVDCQRGNKSYALTSVDIERTIGGYIGSNTKKPVKLKNSDYSFIIEIINDSFYVTDEKIKAFSGFPVGVQGSVLANLDDKYSLLSAWLFLKRGCQIIPFYTKGNHEKELALLQKYSPKKLILNKINDENDLLELSRKYKTRSIVSPTTIETLDKYKKHEDYYELMPLILMDENDIKDKIKEISR